MSEPAKAASLLAAVGLVALVLAWTDATNPTAGAPTTTSSPTTGQPTDRLLDANILDASITVAPLPPQHLPACTARGLSSSLASVIVLSSDPGQRTFNVRVTNDSATTCGIEAGLEVAFASTGEGEAPLAVRRVNPPPGPNAPLSYRDPVLEPRKSATFSVVAAAVEFVPTDQELTSVTIEGPSGVVAHVALPRLRVVAAKEWSGPSTASATSLDRSTLLVPLPPDDVPSCEATTTRALVSPEANLTGTGNAQLVVTNDSADSCALPADVTLRQTGTDARVIPRSAPQSGAYVAPVMPAGGGLLFMIAGNARGVTPPGPSDDRTNEVVLRFPDGGDVIVAGELDPSQFPASTWYGPIDASAGDTEE